MSVRELPTAAVMEAEEDVLGAILSAGSYGVEVGHSTLDRAVATGLEVGDFYRPSLGAIFERLVTMRSLGMPLDPVSVSQELERAGAEPRVLALLHTLACTVVAFGPVAHWAALVHDSATGGSTNGHR